MHDGEYRIDDELVAGLIHDQLPEWSHLPLNRLETSGTVNVAYRLGDGMLVRLPRLADFQNGPGRESRWLPVLAPGLPLEIPHHLHLGTPTEDYPSPWSVLGWIDGVNATRGTLLDLDDTAIRLGEFVLALRDISTEDAPGDSSRGKGLAAADEAFRQYFERFGYDVDRSEVLRTWESCLAVPEWSGPPTWFHGDLHSGNLLAREGALVGVVDFEGCGAGDPASDLIAAWWVFDSVSRRTFRNTVDVDDAQWERGKGWALYMAVAAIPYYTESNPAFAAMARHALAEILDD